MIDKLHGLRLTKAAELAQTAVEETLTFYAFPEEHWRRIRAHNSVFYLTVLPMRVEWRKALMRRRHEHISDTAHRANGSGVRRIYFYLAAQTGYP